ncbi:hypothetical protein [Streptomyces sp. NPDC058371]|uniref:hypothetical protein n=1 Tax=Streptomyces sp. NPDC058371 TaxID=3346463 RepID=UPI0036572B38
MIAAVVALGVVVAVLLVTSGGGDSTDRKSPTETSRNTGRSPTPSLSIPSELPTELPSNLPSELPSGFPSDFPSDLPSSVPSDLATLFANPAGDELPYYTLKSGDCFDTTDSRPGQAATRACRSPHDAEVVKVAELDGTYKTDAALRKAASALCEKPLARKAADQPTGAVRGNLVQYPDPSAYRIGIDTVVCSLAADLGSRQLTRPLT